MSESITGISSGIKAGSSKSVARSISQSINQSINQPSVCCLLSSQEQANAAQGVRKQAEDQSIDPGVVV